MVSDGASHWHRGASEQAGTVEEASGIHEISEQITSNAANSENASKGFRSQGREEQLRATAVCRMLTTMEGHQESSQKVI